MCVTDRGAQWELTEKSPTTVSSVLQVRRLYTALTRANKELTVVNVSALPKGLRGRGERKK